MNDRRNASDHRSATDLSDSDSVNETSRDIEVLEPGDEFPRWFRRVMLLSVMLSAIFLIVAYVYPRVKAPSSSSTSSMPLWKQKANEIIQTALSEDLEKVPQLIAYLDSRSKPIRQNAEWALHYMTDLPWATKTKACRKWWAEHGNDIISGKKTEADRPQPDQFHRRVTPDDMNLEFFFNLLSTREVVPSGETARVDYELGLVNNNEDQPLRIFPPDVLPYRAYRYGAEIPEKLRQKEGIPSKVAKVPVHLQYGPSVALVYLEWIQPSQPDRTQQREFLEFSVLGRNQDVVEPQKMLGVRKPFPIYAGSDRFSEGPHVIARLTLDGRDLLAQMDGQNVRVEFDDISHHLHIFREQPEQVPGYSEKELSKITALARKNGYELQRAERVYVDGFTKNTGIDKSKPFVPEEQSTEDWTTGANKPSAPRTFAGSPSVFQQNRLLFEPELGWGRMQETCENCKEQNTGDPLHYMMGYMNSTSSGKKDRTMIKRRSGRRWVLIFRKQDENGSDEQVSGESAK